MSENKVLLAVCVGRAQANRAIAELRRLGFDEKQISAFGKAYVSEEEVVGVYKAGKRLVARGGAANFWERLWDTLGDGGLFLVPGIGPVVVAGSFTYMLANTIDDVGTIGGLSALGRAIYSLGIPRDNILRYEMEIRANECALVAQGSPELVAQATASLKQVGMAEITTGDGFRAEDVGCMPQMAC
jgi:hypothetical protein